MMDWFWSALSYVFLPDDASHLTVYYLIWMGFFVGINTIWDILTPKTDSFHLSKMKDKVTVLHDAVSFCSSALIITAIMSPTVRQVAKDTTIPLVLAGASGILRSLPALCPYPTK